MTKKTGNNNKMIYEKPKRIFEGSGVVNPEESYYVIFERYIARIGVRAFYKDEKPYEKTGQFLLTAWLYQFVKGGEGDLRCEVQSGLGRIDILLTYKEKKYIIETKVSRHDDSTGIIEEGILQLTGKYLATESTAEGYLVVFDTKTPVGAVCKPQYHNAGDKKVTVFAVGIGKPSQHPWMTFFHLCLK